MTENEFKKLCEETATGKRFHFKYRDVEVEGRFIGCADEAVVIDVDGETYLWPRELCDYWESDYPRPSYS